MKKLLSLMALPVLAMAATAAPSLVYFGTYTGDKSQGIYVSRFDSDTGTLSPAELAVATPSPSFLAIHPSKKWLVAVGESGTPAQKGGAVSTFSIDAQSGKLTRLSEQSTKGPGPCHVSVDPSGKMAVVANYGGGSVASFAFMPDGQLAPAAAFFQHKGSGPNPKRQEGPHAHSANISPDGRVVYICDLGLDEILTYELQPSTGGMEPAKPPFVKVKAGAGPRHFAFHPNGKFAYAINELNSTVTTLAIDRKTQTLSPTFSTSTLPSDFTGSSTTAHIEVHPNGKFVYGSNRGHDSIAIFSVDEHTGWLRMIATVPSGGKTPRNFAIDPSGKWLLAAHQGTDNVVVFKLDPESGALEPTGQSIEVGKAVCVKFLQP